VPAGCGDHQRGPHGENRQLGHGQGEADRQAPGAGLHDIWGLTSTTTDAALSLLVMAGWAILITAAAIRVFTRSAVN
jgi:hypothetical protein